MIRNYLKTAFRTLSKNKGFTAINVLGLALGLATCMLIAFFIADELSYDHYNTKADRIYRVDADVKYGGKVASFAIEPAPLAATLAGSFPGVEKAVRLMHNGIFHIKKGNENISENDVIYADSTLFEVFTLPMIYGNPTSALKEPFSVVLTESAARKYFKQSNAIGQILTINDTVHYKVTGVIKDVPHQSHFNFGLFLSMSSIPMSLDNNWLSSEFNTYVLLKSETNLNTINSQLPQIIHKYVGAQWLSVIGTSFDAFEKSGNYFKLNLTPLTDIHLRSDRDSELGNNGSIQYVYIFCAIGLFILLIACVNFVNLSTARSANRAREVGVRKTLGSSRKNLIYQFLSESYIVTFIAAAIALVIAAMLLPAFNSLSGKELLFTWALFVKLLPALLFVIAIIGLLAGFYPAIVLSSFRPTDVLKGKLSTGFKGSLRSFLVVFQFAISIFLIIGTMVIYNQLRYIQTKNLGYNRSQVLVIQNVNNLGNQAELLKQDIKQLPGVTDATLSGFLPTNDYRNTNSIFQDPTLDQHSAILPQVWSVDEDYLSTLGMQLIKGRNFSRQLSTDSTAVIINQSAAKAMGVIDPLNKSLYYLYLTNMHTKHIVRYHIIGMVKDFHFSSLRDNISPLLFKLGEDHGSLNVKVSTANLPLLMTNITNKWKELAPNQKFNYSFMDQDFDGLYRSEQRIGIIFISFTTLAIVIACLGLFGLAAYAAEQRTKEIGIRKILGASVNAIAGMLSFDFIKLVFIALIVASPVAWYFAQQWLQGFAYRITISWWLPALAAAAALFIALVTVSFQAVKAAIANPVKSLRSE